MVKVLKAKDTAIVLTLALDQWAGATRAETCCLWNGDNPLVSAMEHSSGVGQSLQASGRGGAVQSPVRPVTPRQSGPVERHST